MRLRKKMGSSRTRLFAQNSDARLAGIVIWADRPHLDFFNHGTLKSLKNHKIYKIHAHTIQGCIFEEKKRLRQAHRPRGGGRDPKFDEHSHKSFILVQQNAISHFNVDCLKASNMYTDISHAWIFIKVICYASVCPWIFINVRCYESGDSVDIC